MDAVPAHGTVPVLPAQRTACEHREQYGMAVTPCTLPSGPAIPARVSVELARHLPQESLVAVKLPLLA